MMDIIATTVTLILQMERSWQPMFRHHITNTTGHLAVEPEYWRTSSKIDLQKHPGPFRLKSPSFDLIPMLLGDLRACRWINYHNASEIDLSDWLSDWIWAPY